MSRPFTPPQRLPLALLPLAVLWWVSLVVLGLSGLPRGTLGRLWMYCEQGMVRLLAATVVDGSLAAVAEHGVAAGSVAAVLALGVLLLARARPELVSRWLLGRPVVLGSSLALGCVGLLVGVSGALVGLLPGGSTPDISVLLVSIDTLRADHVGAYGYPRDTSPRLDALAGEALLFERCIATCSSTTASHASMFTGLWPSQHGASFAMKSPIDPASPTLAELLFERGFRTASFNGGATLDRRFGFDRGFQQYRTVDGRFGETVQAFLGWVDEREDAPFFAFLHTFEVHDPYAPPQVQRDRFAGGYAGTLPDEVSRKEHFDAINAGSMTLAPGDLEHIVNLYDGGIASADASLGLLLDELRERGLLERTLVIVTSDHGEEFDEHGMIGRHDHTLFEELLWVPLVVRPPGAAGAAQRCGSLVSGVDIFTTVLEVLGLSGEPGPGRSLLTACAEPEDDRRVIAQRDIENLAGIAVRTPRWKWVREPSWASDRLFDLVEDPAELDERSGEQPALMDSLAGEGERVLELGGGWTADEPGGVELDEDMRSRLEALGYL